MKRVVIALFAGIVCASGLSAAGKTEDMRETYNSVTKVEVHARFLNVQITGGAGETVTLEVLDIPRGVAVSPNVSEGHLMITVDGTPRPSFGIHKGRILLTVPEETEVAVDNSSGSVRIEGIHSADLRAKASSGDVALAAVSGTVTAETSSGSIVVRRLSGTLSARSSSGNIKLEELSGPAVANSSSGAVSLDTTKGSLSITSSSGSIRGSGVSLTADSRFSASSGTIDIDFENQPADLRFDLSASSGSLSVFGTWASKRYLGGNGAILVTGVTSSGSQTYR